MGECQLDGWNGNSGPVNYYAMHAALSEIRSWNLFHLLHDFNRCTRSLSFAFSFILIFVIFTWHVRLVKYISSLVSRAVNGLVKFIEISRLASFDLAFLAVVLAFYVLRLQTRISHIKVNEVIMEQSKAKGERERKWNKLAHPWWLDKRTTWQWKPSAKTDVFSYETRQHIFLSR